MAFLFDFVLHIYLVLLIIAEIFCVISNFHALWLL